MYYSISMLLQKKIFNETTIGISIFHHTVYGLPLYMSAEPIISDYVTMSQWLRALS